MSERNPDGALMLCHIAVARTRWFRISGWLLETGRRNVPQHRDSHNPLKWAIAQIGCLMGDMQTMSINRQYKRNPKKAIGKATRRINGE